MEQIILVNEADEVVGFEEKIRAHELGLLHRAFSIFIFNSKGEMLLQQRAADKYHSPLLWTNTCCSHPNKDENMSDALKRRLQEEMGLESDLEFQFKFIYKTAFSNGLMEHELDHVYMGVTDDQPVPDPAEVHDWKYISLDQLKLEMQHPENFTVWFNISFPMIEKIWKDKFR